MNFRGVSREVSSPAPEEEQPHRHTSVYWGTHTWKAAGQKNVLGFSAERESVMCPCSKCYWHPGLHETKYSQQINRQAPVPLLMTSESTSGVLCSVLQCKRDIDVLEKFQKRETKMFRRLEHLTGEEKLKHLWPSSLVKRRLSRKVTNFAKHLKRKWKEERLVSVVARLETISIIGNTGGVLWTSENSSCLWVRLSTATGCPGRLCSVPLWRTSKALWDTDSL